MKIIFATANRGKLREASEILGERFTLLTPHDLGIDEDIPETGDTLKENSIQKAMYLYERLGCDCFADDTGLEVDALGGAPGVHSARYAGEGHDFDANIRKLLYELRDVPYDQRKGTSHWSAAGPRASATIPSSSRTNSRTGPSPSSARRSRTPSRTAANPCGRWPPG